MIINAAMTRDQPASEDGQNWQFCAADRGDLATLKAAQIRRSRTYLRLSASPVLMSGCDVL